MMGCKAVRGGKGELAIDGRPAMSLSYASPCEGTPRNQVWQWLVRDAEVSYEVIASIPQDQVAARSPDIDQIMHSFKWGRREKQQ